MAKKRVKKAPPLIEQASEEIVEKAAEEGAITFNSATILAMMKRITNLENCIAKMAHFTGTNRVLDEFGIPRWEVTQESMRKRKG